MDLSLLILPLIGTLTALSNLGININSRRLMKKNHHEIIREYFDKNELNIAKTWVDKDKIAAVIHTLDYGRVILQFVRAKFFRNLIQYGILALGTFSFVSYNFDGSIIPHYNFMENIEFWDIPILLINFFIVLWRNHHLLNEDEKVFLKNLAHLEQKFHENVILEKLKFFNDQTTTMFSIGIKQREQEQKEILNKFLSSILKK